MISAIEQIDASARLVPLPSLGMYLADLHRPVQWSQRCDEFQSAVVLINKGYANSPHDEQMRTATQGAFRYISLTLLSRCPTTLRSTNRLAHFGFTCSCLLV